MANANLVKKTKKRKRPSYKQVKAINRKRIKRRQKIIKNYKRLRKMRKIGKVINVQNEGSYHYTTVNKAKLNRKAKLKVSKAFKAGYSPFEFRTSSAIQLTDGIEVNKCKWIYRGSCTLNMIRRAFANFPDKDTLTGNTYSNVDGVYQLSGEQQICFYSNIATYEIVNPTNYDMNLVIYDVLYKQDSRAESVTSYFENYNNNDDFSLNSIGVMNVESSPLKEDPISLIHAGLVRVNTNPVQTWGTSTVVADPTGMALNDIKCHPTDSHMFNIFCKVVKKRIIRLQPGASMSHTFIHKPRLLMSRDYMGYKYKQYFKNSQQNLQEIDREDINIAIRGLTSGTLFKFWGQVTNSGSKDDRSNHVLSLPGKLAIKEIRTIKYYAMDSKYKYIFAENTNWDPQPQTLSKLEIVNSDSIKVINTVNLTDTDNDMHP